MIYAIVPLRIVFLFFASLIDIFFSFHECSGYSLLYVHKNIENMRYESDVLTDWIGSGRFSVNPPPSDWLVLPPSSVSPPRAGCKSLRRALSGNFPLNDLRHRPSSRFNPSSHSRLVAYTSIVFSSWVLGKYSCRVARIQSLLVATRPTEAPCEDVKRR